MAYNEFLKKGYKVKIFDKGINNYNPQLVLLPNGSVVENFNSQSQFKRKLKTYRVEFIKEE